MDRTCGRHRSNVSLICSFLAPLQSHLSHPYSLHVPHALRLVRKDPTLTLNYNREALYEDESFPERGLAALVASKIYYNLREYDESMIFALGAGKLFNIDQEGEFEDTIIGLSIGTLRSYFHPIVRLIHHLYIQQNA